MSEAITISPAAPDQMASDYAALRKAGIGYIEQYAHELWTNYNKSDSGILTLELLCYAITDLSQRTSLDMKDLLASSFGSSSAMADSFLTAARVLPTCPVSEADYRKLFVDISGVRNAWLSRATGNTVHVNCKEADERKRLSFESPAVPPQNRTSFELNGLYAITLDFDNYYIRREIADGAFPDAPAAKQKIVEQVQQAYLSNRNLCEDVASISEVPVHRLMFCADLDLENDTQVSDVYAQVLFRVQQYLSPTLKRHSLAEMKAKKNTDGYPLTIDQIFEGPLLKNGFITDEDLETTALREVVYTSDLIQLIMGIKGVLAVKKVILNDCEPTNPEGHRWCFHIREGHQPRLCTEKVALAFYKDIIPVGNLTDKTKALDKLEELQRQQYEANRKQVADIPVPEGGVYDLSSYRSLANDFPQTYGISRYGLPDAATPERKAQAKQLKAYLLFFDQLLSNYLAQLVNLKSFFSADASAPQTYFGQVVQDMAGVEELYEDYEALKETPDAKGLLRQVLDELENYQDNPIRKNRFLDHLLARFAENFSDYGLLMHALYGEHGNEEILQDKADFLKDYQAICRAKAYNYCQPAWNKDNVAGITRRISRLAGIRDYKARHVAAFNVMATFPSEIGDPQKYRFRLHELLASTRRWVYTTSTRVYEDEPTAEKAMRQAFLPVPPKERFQVRAVAKGFTHVLKAANGRTLARCPRTFKTAEAAWADVEEAIETIIYGGEAIFLVEHLLLRPDKENPAENWMAVCTRPNCEHCEPLDPYSYRVSVVLPGYTTRFANIDYRRYMEKIIRMELPAHVLARICWVGRDQLLVFEEKYKKWLAQKAAACTKKNKAAYAKALNEFLAILADLHTVYPEGVLHNCENEKEENPLVLGRSTLGSLPPVTS